MGLNCPSKRADSLIEPIKGVAETTWGALPIFTGRAAGLEGMDTTGDIAGDATGGAIDDATGALAPLGIWLSGEDWVALAMAGGRPISCNSCLPQLPQNFCSHRFLKPQDGQLLFRRLAQCPQKIASSEL